MRYEAGDLVQWAQGGASGARSWAYHGIGKVHIVGEGGVRTLCGLVPKRNVWRATDSDVQQQGYCSRCQRALPDQPEGGSDDNED